MNTRYLRSGNPLYYITDACCTAFVLVCYRFEVRKCLKPPFVQHFSIILQDNLGMSELMARVLTGANATSYCISTAMAFWIIDRRGRRFLMLTGLSLQCAAYIMVAIAVAMLATAPQQVSLTDNKHANVKIADLS